MLFKAGNQSKPSIISRTELGQNVSDFRIFEDVLRIPPCAAAGKNKEWQRRMNFSADFSVSNTNKMSRVVSGQDRIDFRNNTPCRDDEIREKPTGNKETSRGSSSLSCGGGKDLPGQCQKRLRRGMRRICPPGASRKLTQLARLERERRPFRVCRITNKLNKISVRNQWVWITPLYERMSYSYLQHSVRGSLP